MINLDVFCWHGFATRLGIDFQVISVHHDLGVGIEVAAGPRNLRLGLFLMVNVEVGAVRSLDCDHKTLLFRIGIILVVVGHSRAGLIVVPNGQILKIFVRYVGVVGVGRVGKNLSFLFFQLGNERVNLRLHLRQLVFVVQHFQVAIAHFWIDIFEGVRCGLFVHLRVLSLAISG